MIVDKAVLRNAAKGVAILAIAVALASCGGGGGGGSVSVTPPPPVPFASFGVGFAYDIGQASTATPNALSGADIIPLSLTTYPQSIN